MQERSEGRNLTKTPCFPFDHLSAAQQLIPQAIEEEAGDLTGF